MYTYDNGENEHEARSPEQSLVGLSCTCIQQEQDEDSDEVQHSKCSEEERLQEKREELAIIRVSN